MNKPSALLRKTPATATILRTLTTSARLTPLRQPAAITRCLNNISRHAPQRRFIQWRPFYRRYATKPTPPKYDPTPDLQSPTQSLSLSARLRKLSREYGWSAFGVYIALSMLDFPFCFMAVRYIGADTIGKYEHIVVSYIADMIPQGVKDVWKETKDSVMDGLVIGTQTRAQDQGRGVEVAGQPGVEAYATVTEGNEIGIATGVTGAYGQDVKDAEQMNAGDSASIWTQLALAYAIHKSFIFIRVPLAVAVTPRVVKVLRGWGWDIGKRRPKEVREAAKEAKRAATEARRKGTGA